MYTPRPVIAAGLDRQIQVAAPKGLFADPRVRQRMPFALGMIWGLLTSFAYSLFVDATLVQAAALGGVSVLAMNCWPASFARSIKHPAVFAVALHVALSCISGVLYGSAPSAIFREMLLLPAALTLATVVFSESGAARKLARGFASAGLAFVAIHLAHVDPSQVLVPTYRIYLFLNPNGVAFISGMTSIVMLDWFLTTRGLRSKTLCLVGFAAALLILFATKSRTAALATLLGVTALLLFAIGRKHLHRVIILLCAVLLGLFTTDRYHRAEVARGLSTTYSFDSHGRAVLTGTGRFRTWKYAVTGILRHKPLLGVGPDNYRNMLRNRFVDGSGSVHNGLLRTLLDSGILGAMPLVLVVLTSARVLVFTREREAVALEAGLFSMGIMESIGEEFFFSFGNPASLLFMLAMVSLVLQPTKNGNPNDELVRV